MHVLTSEQFDAQQLEKLFDLADSFRAQMADPKQRRKLAARYIDRKICNLFYEPSTRTRLSFGFAADSLGVRGQGTENAREFSSAAKGETLEDSIQVINEYGVDIIVLRHHETGAAVRAAAVSKAAIINAGDGRGEHPTQALLDAYTVWHRFGRLDNLHIVMGGDLKYGRTARSLALLLAKYPGNRLTFVSVPELQMDNDVKVKLDERNVPYAETSDMYTALRKADVVYWTRLQKERLEHPEAMPTDGFILDTAALKILPAKAIIMHPLPRVGEIAPSVDSDPRAQYFPQAGNGLYIRMALIDQILAAGNVVSTRHAA
jgi:aspartate carbamoyltransferase catalytic subunit